MARDLPNPPESGLVNALRFGDDTFRFIEAMQARFDDAAAVPIPGRAPLVVVTNPELVGDALSRPAEFRRVPASGPAALIATQGLVQSEGDLWEQQRGIMGPAFMGPQVRAYANTVGRRVETLVEEWSTTIGDGESITRNLHGEMTALTVRVASEILLGEDIGLERAEQFHSWMQTAGDEFEFGLDAVTPEWVPTRTDPEFKAAAEGILGLAEELIERRRADLAERDPDDEERPKDMLTMLLLAEDKPDVEYPDNQIRDEVSTFLIAGHETTALSLTYTQCLLSQHPEIREQVRQEANEVIGDETPSYDHVSDPNIRVGCFRRRCDCIRRRGRSSGRRRRTCGSGSIGFRRGGDHHAAVVDPSRPAVLRESRAVRPGSVARPLATGGRGLLPVQQWATRLHRSTVLDHGRAVGTGDDCPKLRCRRGRRRAG